MIGAIAGDVIGSIYEHRNIKTKDFPLFSPGCRFTDDTVLTAAVADAVLSGGDFTHHIRRWARAHPNRGYGGTFRKWMWSDDVRPYGSLGNGSAMRVSSIARLARDHDHALELVTRSAAATHNHPEGIRGAQAVMFAMPAAMGGTPPEAIRKEVARIYRYDLSQSVDEIRRWYAFDVTCAGSVPQAITCALEATSFEDAIRNAVSIGGDSDTIAAIAGGIAEVMFGIPEGIAMLTRAHLTPDVCNVVERYAAAIGEGPAEARCSVAGTVH